MVNSKKDRKKEGREREKEGEREEGIKKGRKMEGRKGREKGRKIREITNLNSVLKFSKVVIDTKSKF